MKSKFIITGFSDEIAANFETQLLEIKKLNIAHIEIRGVNGRNITDHSLEEVTDLRKILDEAGVQVSAIGSPIGKINIDDEFEPHFELFKHTVEIAKILGTRYIRIFSFFLDVNKVDFYRLEVMARLKQFTDYVTGSDILLLHENEKDIYGDTPERCFDIMRTLASPNLKLIFDPANFIQCHVEPYPKAYELLKDDVIYFHIKDALLKTGVVVPAGFGDGQIKSLLETLHQKGYQGFLSLEPHLGSFEGFQNLEGKNELLDFKEKSDVSKFRLAYTSLMNLITEVQDGQS